MTFLQPFPELFLLLLYLPPLLCFLLAKKDKLALIQWVISAGLFTLLLIRAKYDDWLPCWISLWMSGVVLQLYCWLELVQQLGRSAKWWHEWWIYFTLEHFYSASASRGEVETIRPLTAMTAKTLTPLATPVTVATTAITEERPCSRFTAISPKDLSGLLQQQQRGKGGEKMHAAPFNKIDWIPTSFRIYLTINPAWFNSRRLSLLLFILTLGSVGVTIFAQYVLGDDYKFELNGGEFWRINLTYYTCRPIGEYYAVYGYFFLIIIPPALFIFDSWRYMQHLYWENCSRFIGALIICIIGIAGSFIIKPRGEPLAWWFNWSWQLFLLVWMEWTEMFWYLAPRIFKSKEKDCAGDTLSRVKSVAIRESQISVVYLFLACEEMLRQGEAVPQLLERMLQLFIAPTAPFYVRLSNHNYVKLCGLVSGEHGEVEVVLKAVQEELTQRLSGLNQVTMGEC